MQRKFLVIAGAILVLAGGGIALAVASSDEEHEPLRGAAAREAKAAAREAIPGGTVGAAVREGDNYEVEVTRPDGNKVEVELDKSYNVTELEDEGRDE